MPATHTPSPEAVKALRFNAGLSVRELAAKAGIGHATLWRFEEGVATPRMASVRALADALNVPVTALLDNEEAA